jgi:NAD(P)-dependent dehydrogenase (short-subunit alcohol dehydrogenase family)
MHNSSPVISVLRTNAYVSSIIVPLPGDITSQDGLKAMADRVRQEVGYINLLIANAGMSGPMLESLKPRYTLQDYVKFAWATPMQEFTDTYGLNCTALYYTILAFMELLDEGNKSSGYEGGKSQVIATASTASFLRHPRAGYAYLSSKAAVISLIKAFSTFCVPWGIRFNAIAAGCTFMPFLQLNRKVLTH